jgi:hypothetical protein
MGDSWDWTFSQGKMLKKMEKAAVTRNLGSLQKLHKSIADGVCAAMSYNWCKRRMRGEKAEAKTYSDSKKLFKKLATEQKSYIESGRGIGYFVDVAKNEGVGMKVPAPNDKAMRGEFGGTAEKMVFCLDRLDPGMYMFNCRGGKGGHAMAMDLDAKGIGSFFDPNIGQMTVAKGDGRTLGEFIAAVILEAEEGDGSKAYADYVTAPKAWWQVIRLDTHDLGKLKSAGFKEEE